MADEKLEKVTLALLRSKFTAEQLKKVNSPVVDGMVAGVFLMPLLWLGLAILVMEGLGSIALFLFLGGILHVVLCLVVAALLDPDVEQKSALAWLIIGALEGAMAAVLVGPAWFGIAGGVATGLYGVQRVLRFGWQSADDVLLAQVDSPLRYGLPLGILQALIQLPENLPPEVETIIDDALEDYCHLVQVLSATGEARSVDIVREFKREAARTLSQLIAWSLKVASLRHVASHRAGDQDATTLADKAERRLREIGQSLHEAAGAALRYVASEEVAARDGLVRLTEELRLQSEARLEMAELTEKS